MFESHFYNETIRNVVTAFGTLFNNISIQKLDGDGEETSKIRVPLAYSTREKFITRLREDSRLDDDEYPNSHVQMTLPRMAFSMGSMNYDATLFQLDGFTSGQITGSTGTDEQRSATGPSGDLTGLTGAVSRIVVGPSGPTADISNYDFNVDKYVLWSETNSIDTTGVTS